jgi:beta-ribofuranosylaminobenzene 5'-phosphate synthase
MTTITAPRAPHPSRGADDIPGDTQEAAVRVASPARLHLGFVDPSATLGRRFGSLGVAIDGFDTVVALRSAAKDHASAAPGCEAALPRAQAALTLMREALAWRRPIGLHLLQVPPAHAGLGSGTQLALAVGKAVCELAGVNWPAVRIAQAQGRGLRSGVGIAAFDRGGLLLDGGPDDRGRPAPLLSRVPMPTAWRVLLVLDPRRRGLHGDAEREALSGLAPLPREQAAAICHEIVMRVLPSAACEQFEPFAAGVTEIQRIVGSHFAPAQAGSAFASPAVAALVSWMAAQAAGVGIGQSSWGPTGFVFVPSDAVAHDLIARARAAGVADPALALHACAFRNTGALCQLLPQAAA